MSIPGLSHDAPRSQAGVESTIARANALDSTTVRWLDEKAHFPFDYERIEAALDKKSRDRGGYAYNVGWYLQQFIKLYCGRAIWRASSGNASRTWDDFLSVPPVDALVLDSDVVFFRRVAFVEAAKMREGRCSATYRYAFSREHHAAYIATNANLLGEEHPAQPSGVAHHMAMRADVVAALESAVMARFGGRPLWAVLVDVLPTEQRRLRQTNVFSEYQLYFHFARQKYPTSVSLRQLYWANGPGPRSVVECSFVDRWPEGVIRAAKHPTDASVVDHAAGYDFVAYHSYAKRRNCIYAPFGTDGVCFGPGCTYSCYKRRDEAKYKRLNRSLVAPRLCRPPLL